MAQLKNFLFCLIMLCLAACSTGGQNAAQDTPFAPSYDAKQEAVDGLVVGRRLMDAGEYELALDAFTRAAAQHGKTPEVLAAAGTANLALGRLGQAEKMLKSSLDTDPNQPETWNNLGVLLMEMGKTAEAEQIFRKAYALDNGQSDSIRDNLRLALAKSNHSGYDVDNNEEYKLVRRGGSDYVIQQTP